MMFRSFLRLFSTPTPPKPVQVSSPAVTLYARIPGDPVSGNSMPTGSANPTQRRGMPSATSTGNHRQRVLSMKIAHIGICSSNRAKRLADLNITTAGDLAFADPAELAKKFGAPRKAASMLRHYRRAIRLAASVPGMMPRDAILLVSIHRRSTRGLASETAGSLHRDLERFAESSQGQSLLRGRRLPSTRRIKQWILQCETGQSNRPSFAQAA